MADQERLDLEARYYAALAAGPEALEELWKKATDTEKTILKEVFGFDCD